MMGRMARFGLASLLPLLALAAPVLAQGTSSPSTTAMPNAKLPVTPESRAAAERALAARMQAERAVAAKAKAEEAAAARAAATTTAAAPNAPARTGAQQSQADREARERDQREADARYERREARMKRTLRSICSSC